MGRENYRLDTKVVSGYDITKDCGVHSERESLYTVSYTHLVNIKCHKVYSLIGETITIQAFVDDLTAEFQTEVIGL